MSEGKSFLRLFSTIYPSCNWSARVSFWLLPRSCLILVMAFARSSLIWPDVILAFQWMFALFRCCVWSQHQRHRAHSNLPFIFALASYKYASHAPLWTNQRMGRLDRQCLDLQAENGGGTPNPEPNYLHWAVMMTWRRLGDAPTLPQIQPPVDPLSDALDLPIHSDSALPSIQTLLPN